MTLNQELLPDKHETRSRAEGNDHVDLVWKTHHKTLTRPHSDNYKGLSLCLDATVGIMTNRWVPARTPTVHRCPQGKAVGGPQHDPQCDKRAQPSSSRQGQTNPSIRRVTISKTLRLTPTTCTWMVQTCTTKKTGTPVFNNIQGCWFFSRNRLISQKRSWKSSKISIFLFSIFSLHFFCIFHHFFSHRFPSFCYLFFLHFAHFIIFFHFCLFLLFLIFVFLLFF